MSKVNWGVLGTADIAKGCTIPGMQQAENCNLYAIAGRSIEKANQFKEEYGFKVAYGSYDELLNDENVQAVYIPLPNQLHYEWVLKAVEAGKHVLCEKPIAPSEAMAKEMFDAAKTKGVLLMEAFAYLHTPYIKAIKEELAAGTIGKVSFMESEFLTSDYALTNIRMQKDCYGGALYDLGCYCTTMILWMLDKEAVDVKAIADYTPEGVDNFTSVVLGFGDRVKAQFNCGMNFETAKNFRFDRLYIHGDKGCIKSYVAFNESGDLKYTVSTEKGEETKTVPSLHNYRLEIEQFSRCILDGEKPYITEDFSLKNARLLDRILKEINY